MGGISRSDFYKRGIEMAKQVTHLNDDVTKLLDGLSHPFRNEIEQLRLSILGAEKGLAENVKWNGPNYCFDNKDRITMRIHPPKQVQIIFHRGAKVQKQPRNRIINDDSGLLTWKENRRAVATFKNMAEIEDSRSNLAKIVKDWISATS